MKKTCYLNNLSAICALGNSIESIEQALFSQQPKSPLQETKQYSPGQAQTLGLVQTDLSECYISASNDNINIHNTIDSIDDSRNSRLLQACLTPLLPSIKKLKQEYGAHRIAVIVGSSTSGIYEGEQAEIEKTKRGHYPKSFHYRQQEVGAPARFAANFLGIKGPSWTISTACTSGAKALAAAQRLLQTGLADVVIAGGCDTLCALTVQGFASLGANSTKQCQPFSRNRCGINIGEAAAFFIMSKQPGPVTLSGYGESSDAHHISAPQPEGLGAEKAIQTALKCAGLKPSDIDYINLHGTATTQNDAMESKAITRVFGSHSRECDTACSSTKSLTGHTLGAAGALEAAFCYLSLTRNDGYLPPHVWDGQIDSDLPPLLGLGKTQLNKPARHILSNSFAFGGNNIALLLSRCEPHND